MVSVLWVGQCRMYRLGGDEPVGWYGVESVGWMEKDL